MSNDILSEITNYIKPASNRPISKPINSSDTLNGQNCAKMYETAQNCLNAIGHAKVNMDKKAVNNRVISSLDVLKDDPQYVQNHVEFCDNLIKHGYSLEDAVVGTDIIFDKLKEESTYRP